MAPWGLNFPKITAQTRQKSGDAHAFEAHGDNVYAQGLAGLGVLAAGTEPQAEAGLVEHEPDYYDGDEHQIGGGVVGEDVLHEAAEGGAGIEHAPQQQGYLGAGIQGHCVRGVKEGLCYHY